MSRHIRCPYCIDGLVFKVMTPSNGEFVCGSCGHHVSLQSPTFNCSCPRCNDAEKHDIEIPARWS
jgi:DNA-directed RNA polymerase subunit RPC12/RpoP